MTTAVLVNQANVLRFKCNDEWDFSVITKIDGEDMKKHVLVMAKMRSVVAFIKPYDIAILDDGSTQLLVPYIVLCESYEEADMYYASLFHNTINLDVKTEYFANPKIENHLHRALVWHDENMDDFIRFLETYESVIGESNILNTDIYSKAIKLKNIL